MKLSGLISKPNVLAAITLLLMGGSREKIIKFSGFSKVKRVLNYSDSTLTIRFPRAFKY